MISKFPAFIIRKMSTYWCDDNRARLIYKRSDTSSRYGETRYKAVHTSYWYFRIENRMEIETYGIPLAIKKQL